MKRLALIALLAACGGGGSETPADACSGETACATECNVGNNLGVGRFCTGGNGECNANPAPFLFCTDDYEPDGTGKGFCTGACGSDADCGDDAFCSGSGMGSKGCVPATCGGTPSSP